MMETICVCVQARNYYPLKWVHPWTFSWTDT